MTIDTEQWDAPTAELETAPTSLLSNLRRRAAELQTDEHVDLELPGYNGQLVGRYRALGVTQMRLIMERAERQGGSWDAAAAADGLASGLVELFGRDADGGLERLFVDEPATYDLELTDALGLHVDERSARAVIFAVFGGGTRAEFRITAHFSQWIEWLQGDRDGTSPGQEVVDTAVGESLTD